MDEKWAIVELQAALREAKQAIEALEVRVAELEGKERMRREDKERQ